jgi:hypothetical protein
MNYETMYSLSATDPLRDSELMPLLSTSQFSYLKDDSYFVADASDLDHPTGNVFVLKSHRTGAEVKMKMDRIERDRDRDIRLWAYSPISPAHSFKLFVFND